MMENNKEPLVSIVCITYNHVKFIRDAIEGFLMQNTNFPFEIIIHDDASIDGTQEIIKEYLEKYPNLFVPVLQTENQYSKGRKIWFDITFPIAKGKYIALCEGDDYWTDSLKLQKQVDFLEANNDYVLCFHNAQFKKNGVLAENFKSKFSFLCKQETYELKDVLELKWFIPTASILFRNIIEIPDWISKLSGGDYGLVYLNANHGLLRFLDFCGSVYRINEGGVSQNKGSKTDILKKRIFESIIYLKITPFKYKYYPLRWLYSNLWRYCYLQIKN